MKRKTTHRPKCEHNSKVHGLHEKWGNVCLNECYTVLVIGS